MSGMSRNRCGPDCSVQIMNGEELYDKLIEKLAIYPTGLKCLDDALDDGFMSGELVEVSGPVASGKTQDLQNHLSKLIYVTAVNASEFLEILEGINQNLNNIRRNLKAVVIDHVGTMLSSLVPKNRDYGFNQLMLAGRLMKKIAKDHNLVVLVINQCIKFNDKPIKPALGQWWYSIPDTIILFDEQDEDRITKASVVKSYRYLHKRPNSLSIRFRIGSKGTVDVA